MSNTVTNPNALVYVYIYVITSNVGNTQLHHCSFVSGRGIGKMCMVCMAFSISPLVWEKERGKVCANVKTNLHANLTGFQYRRWDWIPNSLCLVPHMVPLWQAFSLSHNLYKWCYCRKSCRSKEGFCVPSLHSYSWQYKTTHAVLNSAR